MAETQMIARHIPDRLEGRGARLIKSWETLLVAVALAIFLVN
jgi:rhamnose transport system permease protein